MSKQSKIAIGSGGFIGKGLLKGTQTRYDFVPSKELILYFVPSVKDFGFTGSVIFLRRIPDFTDAGGYHCRKAAKRIQPLLCIWSSFCVFLSYCD